jgi:hypothetical protein
MINSSIINTKTLNQCMGLFDFFKKKPTADQQPTSAPVDPNIYLIQLLWIRLTAMDYRVKRHPQYQSLIVNEAVEIASVIIDDPNNHPLVMHAMILTMHSDYFPNGIEEHVAGLGETLEQKITSVIDNYVNSTFTTIMEGLSDKHDVRLDFTTTAAGETQLWHPCLGSTILQGKWITEPSNEAMYDLIKDKVKDKLTGNPFNWLKLYISKRDDGTIIGECSWNNEPWPDGLTELTHFAQTWEVDGAFYGMKQFIVFRKCNAEQH